MAADRQQPKATSDRPLRFSEPLAPQFGIQSRPYLMSSRMIPSGSTAQPAEIWISLPFIACQSSFFHG